MVLSQQKSKSPYLIELTALSDELLDAVIDIVLQSATFVRHSRPQRPHVALLVLCLVRNATKI